MSKTLLVVAVACALASAIAAADINDWPSHDHDAGGQRFSPLKQITPSNVSKLQRAWTFDSGVTGLQVTPLVVNGIMYVTAGNDIVALEPESAKSHLAVHARRRPSASEASRTGPAIATRRRVCSAARATACSPSTRSVASRLSASAMTVRLI